MKVAGARQDVSANTLGFKIPNILHNVHSRILFSKGYKDHAKSDTTALYLSHRFNPMKGHFQWHKDEKLQLISRAV